MDISKTQNDAGETKLSEAKVSLMNKAAVGISRLQSFLTEEAGKLTFFPNHLKK